MNASCFTGTYYYIEMFQDVPYIIVVVCDVLIVVLTVITVTWNHRGMSTSSRNEQNAVLATETAITASTASVEQKWIFARHCD